jgi:hypothetical protein
MSDDFDWADVADEIVVRQQAQIAVYLNSHGDIVIRQAGWPDDDVWIVVHPRMRWPSHAP